MIYKYFLPDEGQTVDDAYKVESKTDFNEPWKTLIAEDCADDFHSNHDGWESNWPITITVVAPDGDSATFKVDREAVPSFYAVEVKP